jgi:hypothetical protein
MLQSQADRPVGFHKKILAKDCSEPTRISILGAVDASPAWHLESGFVQTLAEDGSPPKDLRCIRSPSGLRN